MRNHSRTSTVRRGVRRLALVVAAVGSVAAANAAVSAQMEQGPGAGTQFIACTDQAWADYNKCLVDAGGPFSRKLCDLAFEADIIWCGAVLKRQLSTGSL
ncbi:MAG TPA: hypothetical protein VF035_04435 [Longimicrobiales bacterium]